MTTAVTPQLETPGNNLMSKCVLLIVNSSMIGNVRKVSKSHIEVDADKAMIDVKKKLLDSKELQAIVSLNGEVTRWIGNYCLPSLFKNGVYLLPLDLTSKVDAKLAEFKAKREELVEAFIAVYPSLIEESQARLRTVFSLQDYPTVETVRNCFSFSWFYGTWDTPEALKTRISADFYEKELEKNESRWKDTGEYITAALCESFSELVNRIVEKTSGEEDGKKKIFRDSLVNNLSEFFETFTPRNLADTSSSKKLAELVEKGKKLIRGLDADDLRRKEALRTSVNLGFNKIKSQLDAMLEDAPTRKITFDEAA